MKPTRVLVADDHPIVRLGIRQMLDNEPDLSICAEASTPEEAVESVGRDHPDLALVDLSFGALSGLDLIRHLREIAPDLPILVLSMHDESLFAQRALRAGAKGYITKHEAITHLVSAIRQVLSGHIYVSDRVSQQVLEGLGHTMDRSGDRVATLSDRELQVLTMIGHGTATAEIAGRLGISIKTVETYRSNIKAKLSLRDSTDLIRFAASWVEHL
ncbi:MAG TPA: response regulator transcription factor [Vicinamibacterales bacterium]|nr:response regulator transcription factor [Vicinamibacterales bacterium]